MPAETVLAGLSMGSAVAAALLTERPGTAGLLLLHNTGGGAEQAMTDAGAAVQIFRYLGAGHLFTDPATPDHDGPAAALAWQRSLSFLADL